MLKKSVLPILLISAVVITFSLNEAGAGLPRLPMPPPPPNVDVRVNGNLPTPPNVNVRVDGYLPAPPGVNVQIDSGRPYYVERDRRVYMERERPRKHYKKHKKHYDDRGYGYGREERHNHGRHND